MKYNLHKILAFYCSRH